MHRIRCDINMAHVILLVLLLAIGSHSKMGSVRGCRFVRATPNEVISLN